MRALLLISVLFLSSTGFSASIWHVEGKQEFYLFGTVHILKPDTYPLPAVYQRSFSQCDNLWIEADLNEMKDPSVMASVQAMMLLPQGKTLQSELSADAYAALEALAEVAGVPLSLVQGVKPWAASNMLTMTIFEKKGFESEQGLDIYLQAKAVEMGIPVNTFETILWQMQMFDTLGSDYSDEFVEFSTNDIDQADTMIDAIYDNWKSGNLDALYDIADFGEYPQIESVMLTERNNNWMDTLLNASNGQTQCVAVGALHMAGKHGLIQQFSEAGFKVTQLD
ncbi:TraB/GumN family protein [Reinekea marinisedimentorum]|uniref:TraB family protein n=1 Tax=Reinekea marinisedimentorum TaxID=230495 RepID=A0A4R3IFZ8_9GAMM|nr:TraB/GumN family protein [Reinekea marinisedimentorum]TCS43922.1 hypothetical protein BCF53_101265 [Reinekea marinisedimentorum]